MDPEIQKCPFPTYRQVREAGPVFIDPVTGWYFVTDYELVRKLTADTPNLSSCNGILMYKQQSEVQHKADRICAEEGVPRSEESRVWKALVRQSRSRVWTH